MPLFTQQKCLEGIFGECGKISKIHEQEKAGNIEEDKEEVSNFFASKTITSLHVAYIKFESINGLQTALKMARQGKPISLAQLDCRPPVGITSKSSFLYHISVCLTFSC